MIIAPMQSATVKSNLLPKMYVRQDVQMVKYFFKFGKVLGVTPIQKEKHPMVCVIYKLYVVILLNFALFGSIFSIINRYNEFWKENTISQVTLEFVEVTSELLFMLCNFLGALRYGNNWRIIFSNLEKVDNELDMEKLQIINGYWYIGKLLLFHFAYLFLHTYELSVWIAKSSNISNEYGYILYRIVMYYQFFMTLFTARLIEVLRSRFLALEKILKDVSSRNIIIVSQNDNQYILGEMKKLRRLYGLLYNVHQNVNLMFGYSVFYGTILNILVVLGDLNYIVQFAHTSDENFNIGVSFITFLYSLLYSIVTLSVVMSCDGLEIIGKKMVTTCYLYKDVIERTTLSKELIFFAEYIEELIPTFSAAGFFQVNQKLLSTLVSAIITYFIIIIQFNLRF